MAAVAASIGVRPAPPLPPVAGASALAVLHGERVRLRSWTDADREPFAAMNADAEVMRHLIAPLGRGESDAYAARIAGRIDALGRGLWALEVPGLAFAGFVGLAPVPFALPFEGIAPEAEEIGWRLARAAWGHGYATEAASLVLQHALGVVGLPQVVSYTAVGNRRSEAVMERIGLLRRGEFDHPRLADGHRLRRHVLYGRDATSATSKDTAA